MFRFKTLSIFTKCMSYLYVIYKMQVLPICYLQNVGLTYMLFTKCMSYLYVIKKMYVLPKCACGIQHISNSIVTFQVKCLKVSNTGLYCHFSQTPSLLSIQSDIKRWNNIIMMNHIITVDKLHVRQKTILSYYIYWLTTRNRRFTPCLSPATEDSHLVNHPQQQIHTLLITHNR